MQWESDGVSAGIPEWRLVNSVDSLWCSFVAIAVPLFKDDG